MSLYEIGFIGANVQRFNLADRFAAVRQGATGFAPNVTYNQAPITSGGKNVVTEGKGEKAPVIPFASVSGCALSSISR